MKLQESLKGLICEIASLENILQIKETITTSFLESNMEQVKTEFGEMEEQIQKVSDLNKNYENKSKLYASQIKRVGEIELIAQEYKNIKKQNDEKLLTIKNNFEFINTKFELFGTPLLDNNLETVSSIGKQLSSNLKILLEEHNKLIANQEALSIVNTALTEFETRKLGYTEQFAKLERESKELDEKKQFFATQLEAQMASFVLKSPLQEENRLQEKVANEHEIVNQLSADKTTVGTTLVARKEILDKLLGEKIELDKNKQHCKENLDQKLEENKFETISVLEEALQLENNVFVPYIM